MMKTVVYQIISGLILSLPNFLSGYAVTWPSYATVLLASENSPIGYKISKSDVSWIGSVIMLTSMFSSAMSGYLTDTIGRKKSELLSGLGITIALCLIATASSVVQIIIGRALYGFSFGIHLPVAFIYINEISQPHIRGSMASGLTLSFCTGALLSYITGWVCSYDFINYTCLTISIVFVVFMYFLKESPVFLISRGEDKEALRSLKFYRSTSKTNEDIVKEFEYLKSQREPTFHSNGPESTELTKLNLDTENKTKEDTSAWKILYTSKSTRRALITVTLHLFIGIFTGAIAVQSYASYFFTLAAPELSSNLCSVILAVVIAAGSVLTTVINDLVNRRTLLISSSVMCSVCLGSLVTMLRWAWAPAWGIPAAILVYSFFYQVGINNVPMVQMSESFMPKVRGLTSAISMCCLCSTNFIVLAFFGPAVDLLGLQGLYLLFFVISILYSAMSFFMMKETRGVPLEDIQEMYDSGWWYWQ